VCSPITPPADCGAAATRSGFILCIVCRCFSCRWVPQNEEFPYTIVTRGSLQEHVPYQVTNTCDLSHSQVERRVAFEDLESHMTTPKLWGAHETDLLNRAADKLVCYAQKVGVSPDEMISLLDSGMSIRDLLLFLASKDSRRAHE